MLNTIAIRTFNTNAQKIKRNLMKQKKTVRKSVFFLTNLLCNFNRGLLVLFWCKCCYGILGSATSKCKYKILFFFKSLSFFDYILKKLSKILVMAYLGFKLLPKFYIPIKVCMSNQWMSLDKIPKFINMGFNVFRPGVLSSLNWKVIISVRI